MSDDVHELIRRYNVREAFWSLYENPENNDAAGLRLFLQILSFNNNVALLQPDYGMAIKLVCKRTDKDLTGLSKMWGCPDLPDSLDYPEVTVNDDGELVDDPMTFICQIRLEDIAALDMDGALPHTGMLYFFASLDHFLGDFDAPASPGMGRWDERFFKVLYSGDCENLHTHSIVYDDGTHYGLEAEEITFQQCRDDEDGVKMLGRPCLDEVGELYPGWTSLLQLDCCDEWNLQFYDCGILCFMMNGKRIECYLHSF